MQGCDCGAPPPSGNHVLGRPPGRGQRRAGSHVNGRAARLPQNTYDRTATMTPAGCCRHLAVRCASGQGRKRRHCGYVAEARAVRAAALVAQWMCATLSQTFAQCNQADKPFGRFRRFGSAFRGHSYRSGPHPGMGTSHLPKTRTRLCVGVRTALPFPPQPIHTTMTGGTR